MLSPLPEQLRDIDSFNESSDAERSKNGISSSSDEE